jgi:uncharacterized membrane protein
MTTGTAPLNSSRSHTKLVFFLLFFATTIYAAYLKNARILDPASPIARHFAPAGWYLVVHGVFGAVAMVVAAFQFSNRLRARYLGVHRVLGYVYVTSVFISAPLAAVVVLKIPKSLPLTAANWTQSFAWVATTAMALYCVRKGNLVQHRRWMIRSYPFAMVFTVTRAVLAFFPSVATMPGSVETVVFTSVALAAFLPSVYLDWPAALKRTAPKAASV